MTNTDNPESLTTDDNNVDPPSLRHTNDIIGEDNSSATTDLMNRISLLESELLMERERNAHLTHTIEMERNSFTSRLEKLEADMSQQNTSSFSAPPLKRAKTPPPSKSMKPCLTPEQQTKIAINRAAALQIRQQKLVSQSLPYTPPRHLSSANTKSSGPHPPPYPPPPLHSHRKPTSAPPKPSNPPKIDPVLAAILKQQEKILEQNSSMISQLTTSVAALKSTAESQALTAHDALQESITARKIKGPTLSIFPKFGNTNDDFIKWYHDILSIVSLSEWEGIYDHKLRKVVNNTTPSNSIISEHFYRALRLAFKGYAATTMDGHSSSLQSLGIEFFNKSLQVFNPKWPPSLHNTKMVEFYSLFRPPTDTIDTYSATFKRWVSQLDYNDIHLTTNQLATQFINGLGADFTTIRNQIPRPPEWQSTDLDVLTTTAREYLANIKGNREINKLQKTSMRSTTQAPPDTNQPPTRPNQPSGSTRQSRNQSHGSLPPNLPNSSSSIVTPPQSDTQPSDRVDNRTPSQIEICREIGFGVHTPERIHHWQSLVGPGRCYYHGTNHDSNQCIVLKKYITLAASGPRPTTTFVPRHVPTSQPDNNSTRQPPSSLTVPPAQPPPTARNVNSSQVSELTANADTSTPESVPPATTPAARRVVQEDHSSVTSNDAFDFVVDNEYNQEFDYYLSLSLNSASTLFKPTTHISLAAKYLFNSLSTESQTIYDQWLQCINTVPTPHSPHDIPPRQIEPPTTTIPVIPQIHSKAWALHYLLQQPSSLLQFNNAYYSSPPQDTLNHEHTAQHSPLFARNTTHDKTMQQISKFVVDSGANRHMCNNKDLFFNITSYNGPNPYVTLGNGKTKCPIKGIGSIEFEITSGQKLRFHNVIFVPDLDVSLFSIKQHMQYEGCYEHSQNNKCYIAFPNMIIKAQNNNEIEFEVLPPSTDHTVQPIFDEATAIVYNNKTTTITMPSTPERNQQVSIASTVKSKPVQYVPRQATNGSIGYDLRAPQDASISPQSRKAIPLGFSMSIPKGLYGRIASRSGLALKKNIDVAAGVIDPDYRGEVKVLLVNSSQKKHIIRKGDAIAQIIFETAATPAIKLMSHLSPSKRNKGGFGSTDTPSARNMTHTIPDDNVSPHSTTTHHTIETESDQDISTESSTNIPPIIRPVDKPKSTAPTTVTITEDSLRKCIGFQDTNRIIPHLRECFKSNFHLSNIDREPILDIGEITTIDKSRISTKMVTLPPKFGDVLHMDIGYGCNAGINGIKYAL